MPVLLDLVFYLRSLIQLVKAVIDITPFFVRADHLIEPVVNIWRIANILPYFIEYIPIRKIYVFVSMSVFIAL